MNIRLTLFMLVLCMSSICIGQETGSYTDHATLVSIVSETGAQSFSGVLGAVTSSNFLFMCPKTTIL